MSSDHFARLDGDRPDGATCFFRIAEIGFHRWRKSVNEM